MSPGGLCFEVLLSDCLNLVVGEQVPDAASAVLGDESVCLVAGGELSSEQSEAADAVGDLGSEHCSCPFLSTPCADRSKISAPRILCQVLGLKIYPPWHHSVRDALLFPQSQYGRVVIPSVDDLVSRSNPCQDSTLDLVVFAVVMVGSHVKRG